MIPIAAKAGPVLILVGSQAGLEEVGALMGRLSIPSDGYQIRVIGEEGVPGELARAKQEFSGQFHLYPVNPQRSDWLAQLLAGLEEQGQLPVGDLGLAIQATQDYFQFV